MTRLRTAVVSLLTSIRPTNIARLIVPVVVGEAVETQARRTLPHVIKKRQKIIAPLVAHRNSATTVIFVRMMLGIEAALFSACPRCIGGTFAFFVPVCGVAFTQSFTTTATAAFKSAACQIARLHDAVVSAFTSTKPACISSRHDAAQNGQVKNLLTGKIYAGATRLATTLGNVVKKTVAGNLFLATAVTTTKPFLLARISKNGQLAKAPTGKINPFHTLFLPQFCGEFQ